jgi:two-component system nitrogen regulation response regulator NtrX
MPASDDDTGEQKMVNAISTERFFSPAAGLPPMVLIVDEDQARGVALARTLEDAGYLVACAESCEAARSMIAARRPELIVTDVFLPGMCGLALIDLIRQRDLQIPVIVLTGEPQQGGFDLAAAARRLGARMALSKPESTPARLVRAVFAVLGRRGSPVMQTAA